jgi:hypothetical protein
MDSRPPVTPYRTLRLYEWLLLLLLLGLLGGVRAAEVYKCTDPAGGVAYQDRPCVATAHADTVMLAPAPPAAPSPRYALAESASRVRAMRERPATVRHGGDLAYECRSTDGARFYRFGGCPRSLAAETGAASPRHGRSGVGVSARTVPLAFACAEMHRAGAIGRRGHEHDEVVSTYERNLGHDPCR